jgi:hypothetical protein
MNSSLNGSWSYRSFLFTPESGNVVGTIMCTDHDLLKQPNGTLGPFVPVPIQT